MDNLIQVNANSRASEDLVLHLMEERGADLAVVSEPYHVPDDSR